MPPRRPVLLRKCQHFYHWDQAEGESISQYIAALQKAARHCQFVDLDDYLLDRLVSGVRDENLKRRLIAKSELSFQEVLDEACAAKLAALSLADLPRGQVSNKLRAEPVHYNDAQFSDEDDVGVTSDVDRIKDTQHPTRQPGRAPGGCWSCGGSHSRAVCRLKEAICRWCSQRGHIAHVCQSQKPAEMPPPTPRGDRRAPVRRTGAQSSRSAWGREPGGVNWVYPAHDVTAWPKITLSVTIEGRPCPMEVDMGSANSIVSWSMIKRMVPHMAKRHLEPCRLQLQDYQGNPIAIVGTGHFRVQFKDFCGRLPLVVVEAPLPSLLGLNWFQALGLQIQGVHALQMAELDMLVQEFPAVFDGKLGCYKGPPVSFSLDPMVPPR